MDCSQGAGAGSWPFILRMDNAHNHKCIIGHNALHWGFVCSWHGVFRFWFWVHSLHGLVLGKCFSEKKINPFPWYLGEHLGVYFFMSTTGHTCGLVQDPLQRRSPLAE